jgi:hypothetical protein
MKVQKGKSYTVQLRASDGLSFVPDAGSAAHKPAGETEKTNP